MVLWKRLNTETDPKVSLGPSPSFFQELSEIPQKLKSVEGFPNILDRFPLYLHFIRFPFFGCVSSLFGSVSSLKKVLNPQFVDRFP